MIRLFTTLAICLWASLSVAQGLPAPKTMDDTLQLMYDFLLEQPDFSTVEFTDDTAIELFRDGETIGVLYPDNLTSYLQAAETDQERREIFDRHMHTVITGLNDVNADFTLAQIMPVLRNQSYVANTGTDVEMISDTFAGDLAIFYVIDYPDKVDILSIDRLDDTDFTVDDIKNAALLNLQSRMEMVQIEHNAEFGISWFILDGYYESSFAIDEELWASLADKYDDLIMIAPNRDYLVFGDAGNQDAYNAMKGIAIDVNMQFGGALSADVFHWTDDGWVAQ